MKLFFSELAYLNELYSRLESEISAAAHTDTAERVGLLAEVVLRNRDLLERIEQMNSRIQQMTEEWHKFDHCIDDPVREEIRALAHGVADQGRKLAAASGLAVMALADRVNSIRREITALENGTRYLDSVRPPRTNYPKFLDSHG